MAAGVACSTEAVIGVGVLAAGSYGADASLAVLLRMAPNYPADAGSLGFLTGPG